VLLHGPFEAAAAAHAGETALVADGGRYTYADLDGRARRLAAGLQERGLRRGDRVAVLLPSGLELVVSLLATLRAGGVFMPLGAQTREPRLRYLLGDARPACLLTHADLAAAWEDAARDAPGLHTVGVVGEHASSGPVVPFGALSGPGPVAAPGTIDQDLAALLYTSGSTGEPKGVMLTHLNLVSIIDSVQAYLGLRQDDVVMCSLPLSFGYGLTQVLLSFRAGARLVLEGFAFPVRVLEALAREQATVFAGVPTMFTTLLALESLARFDLQRLRILTNAGSALPEERLHALRRHFPHARLFSMYGQTECIRVTFLPPEELDRRPTSVGRGLANQELWLEDAEGRRLPPGGTGELVVRGSHVMRGYWGLPEETERRLRPGPLPGERVLHTGDIFRTDEEGYLYFVSRTDDIIKTRGEKVAPRGVEEVLFTLEGIREAAVVGVPDPVLGEAVKAFVSLQPGYELTERQIIRHCLAYLEGFMAPRHVETLPELPRTPNGKVDKRRLRQRGPAGEP
jgi:amino acid adenylation domain-containing protein